MAARLPVREIGELVDFAAAIAFLISERARLVSVYVLAVDGGLDGLVRLSGSGQILELQRARSRRSATPRTVCTP